MQADTGSVGVHVPDMMLRYCDLVRDLDGTTDPERVAEVEQAIARLTGRSFETGRLMNPFNRGEEVQL